MKEQALHLTAHFQSRRTQRQWSVALLIALLLERKRQEQKDHTNVLSLLRKLHAQGHMLKTH